MKKVVVQGYILSEENDSSKENDVLLNNDIPCYIFGLFDSVQDKITNKAGVRSFSDRKRCIGHDISIINSCNIKIYYLNQKSSLEEAENCLASVFDGRYYTDRYLKGYSEYTITGYQIKQCRIGNHDLINEIKSHVGEYLIFVMEWEDK